MSFHVVLPSLCRPTRYLWPSYHTGIIITWFYLDTTWQLALTPCLIVSRGLVGWQFTSRTLWLVRVCDPEKDEEGLANMNHSCGMDHGTWQPAVLRASLSGTFLGCRKPCLEFAGSTLGCRDYELREKKGCHCPCTEICKHKEARWIIANFWGGWYLWHTEKDVCWHIHARKFRQHKEQLVNNYLKTGPRYFHVKSSQ